MCLNLIQSVVLLGTMAAMGCYSAPVVHAQEYSYDRNVYDDDTYTPVPKEPVVDEPQVDVNLFYTELAPHGRWVVIADYGRCWVPVGVAAAWRPYTVGHWAYTEYGWTWVSDEPWGWATYHYGRWAILPGYGWTWLPGGVWAPAWVAWRCGDGYVGWAPLPPVRYRPLGDRHFYADRIPAISFTFVNERLITEPEIHRHVLPPVRNITIIRKTTNITKIEVVNKTVVNHGVPIDRIQRDTGRRIERVNVREVSRPADAKQAPDRRDVAIYRPQPTAAAVDRAPRREAPEPRTTERKAAVREPVATVRPVTPERPVNADKATAAPAKATPDTRSVERKSPTVRPVPEARPAEGKPVRVNEQPRRAAPAPVAEQRPTQASPARASAPAKAQPAPGAEAERREATPAREPARREK